MSLLRVINRRIALAALGCTLAMSSMSSFAFQQAGKLIVGSDMTFFPYEYMDKDHPAGFDIEFMDGVAKAMGLKAENIDTRFPNLILGLQAGKFDVLNSSMYITAERMKVIDMVPYLKSGESLLALKGASFQPKVPEDLCGHKLGSMGGTVWLKQMHQLSDDYCVKKGLQPIAISEFVTDPQTTQALLSHAVDAQITDAAVARGVIQKLGSRVVISSNTLIYPVLNGFGIKKGDGADKKALLAGIEKFKKTPAYAALLKKYNFEAPTADDIASLMPKQ
ncbi:ABC transporter substrate-binding protein [Robbsia sp. KACC 23696]|uniref:ABC transporter substrate-binding protein n=1 Tax=Robbsia sp. KACC 23696 TaxID=3149231 RepID=UPI00325B2731